MKITKKQESDKFVITNANCKIINDAWLMVNSDNYQYDCPHELSKTGDGQTANDFYTITTEHRDMLE